MYIVNNPLQCFNLHLPAKSFYSSEIIHEKPLEVPRPGKKMEVETFGYQAALYCLPISALIYYKL